MLKRLTVQKGPVTHLLRSFSLRRATYDADFKLREDIKFLGSMLGDAVRTDDPEVFNCVERLRKLARKVKLSIHTVLSYHSTDIYHDISLS
jgi:hypothetical protein